MNFLLVICLLAPLLANGQHSDSHNFFDDKYKLSWESTGDRITFTAECETEGWVGIGISETPDMVDSDLFIAKVELQPVAEVKGGQVWRMRF